VDVDVIDGFAATNYPGEGGLSLELVREALRVFATQRNLAAIEICAYNPEKDPDGSAARVVIDLIGDVLGERLRALQADAPAHSAEVKTGDAPSAVPEDPAAKAPGVTAGEAWSSDLLEAGSEVPDATPEGASEEGPAASPRVSEESEDVGPASSIETSEEADNSNS